MAAPAVAQLYRQYLREAFTDLCPALSLTAIEDLVDQAVDLAREYSAAALPSDAWMP